MDKSEFDALAMNAWNSMLLPGETLEPGRNTDADFDLVACVDIHGGFQGSLSFECDEPLARDIAASMLACEPEDIGRAEMMDALREVANLLGGNVKGLLAQGCSLSLPRATVGAEAALTNGRQRVLQETCFASRGRMLRIRVLVDGTRSVAR